MGFLGIYTPQCGLRIHNYVKLLMRHVGFIRILLLIKTHFPVSVIHYVTLPH